MVFQALKSTPLARYVDPEVAKNFQSYDPVRGESEADVVRTNYEKDEGKQAEQSGGIIVPP